MVFEPHLTRPKVCVVGRQSPAEVRRFRERIYRRTGVRCAQLDQLFRHRDYEVLKFNISDLLGDSLNFYRCEHSISNLLRIQASVLLDRDFGIRGFPKTLLRIPDVSRRNALIHSHRCHLCVLTSKPAIVVLTATWGAAGALFGEFKARLKPEDG